MILEPGGSLLLVPTGGPVEGHRGREGSMAGPADSFSHARFQIDRVAGSGFQCGPDRREMRFVASPDRLTARPQKHFTQLRDEKTLGVYHGGGRREGDLGENRVAVAERDAQLNVGMIEDRFAG